MVADPRAHGQPLSPARPRAGRRPLGAVALSAITGFGILLSLSIGASSIPFAEVVAAIISYDNELTEHLVIRELRLPRTGLTLLVGAGLGAAGALMQGVTRNPLADPGLLGVNAGAAFAVVLAIWMFDINHTLALVWFAFAGAALSTVVVYVLGTIGRGGATPVRLALAGAALAALLFAGTRAVVLIDQATLDQFRFWAVGSLAGRDPQTILHAAPFIAVGLVLAIGVARPLNAIALGDDAAQSLGVNLCAVRAVSVVAITVLCGAAVAAAGPIGFVGLVVPHAVRMWFGNDQRWLIPASALAGTALLLMCDTIGRVIARPGEVQVGIVTAIVGGPAFILLVRRTRLAQL